MANRQTLLVFGIAGVVSYMLWGEEIQSALGFSAKGGAEVTPLSSIIERIREKFTPSDLEQIDVERTGATVDIHPIQHDGSAAYEESFAMDKSSLFVNDAPFGPGVSDVSISAESPYEYNLKAEDFQFFNAQAPGQGIIPSSIKALSTHEPTSRDVCCKPVSGMDLSGISSLPVGAEENSRIGLSRVQGKTNHDVLTPGANDGYTDGSTTRHLSEWMSDGHVDVINDACVMFRAHIGGNEIMLRRV